MRHKCSDPKCPLCRGKTFMEASSKEEIKTIDVSNGEPQAISLVKETTVLLKGKHVPEQKFTLIPGSYVVNEVLKNIYTMNSRGKYEKVGTQHFLVAERTK